MALEHWSNEDKVFLDHFDFKMLINAIRNAIKNAIRINWVNFRKNAALYALKTLIWWKRQEIRFSKVKISYKVNVIELKYIRFQKNPLLYALRKLTFAKFQRYTVWKR